jgi:hypothetical protein
LSDDAWERFSDPENFGKDFEGVKGLNRNMLKDRRYDNQGSGFIGRNAGDMEVAARNKDRRYLENASKFAFFFTKEFLVKRMLEVLNAEGKPEYIGFRKTCEDLFPLFKKTFFLRDDSLLECLYDDDMMHLDVENATLFFWWCGVCKKSSVKTLKRSPPENSVPAKKMDETLKRKCLEVLGGLEQHSSGWVFNQLVDPDVCGALDYFDVIKEPMDLGTIRGRLLRGTYQSIDDFKDDVILTFDNAMTYSPVGHEVHRMATSLKEAFETDYDNELVDQLSHQTTNSLPTVVSMEVDEEPENTCPICFEEKDDIKPILHWEAQGDISGHKMCGDCAKQYTKNDCPFCGEVSLKENILACIRDLIVEVKNKSSGGDPNELAALMETWQFFEMEYGDNPKVIYRVAMLVLQDPEFKHLLENGVRMKAPWMRDAAGMLFRLYSLSVEGNLKVTPSEKALLAECYKTITALVKAPDIQSEGHYYGAIYSQAMVPYICALQSGQSTRQLELIVKEVGNLIVSQYRKNRWSNPHLRQQIPERIVAEYMPIVSANIWGGERKDPVWRAFYKN